MLQNLVSLLGVGVMLALAWLLSTNRRAFPWRTVFWGLGLQLGFALLLLRTSWGQSVFGWIRLAIMRVLSFTDPGAEFVFGSLYRTGESVVANAKPEQGYWLALDSTSGNPIELGTIFAIHILPIIIFFAALISILYHLGVMQRLVEGMAWLMRRTMGITGRESLSAAANVFIGQTEAPVLIRPYLPKLSQSELMAVMSAGFATVAGSVMGAYVRFGIDAGHLLTASVMSAPAALVMAKIMVPETTKPEGDGVDSTRAVVVKEHANVLDAAAGGAATGMKLALNVAAMLIAFIALVAMIDYLLGLVGLSLQRIFGVVLSPLAWAMGVPWSEAARFGSLLGTKVAVNEFVAYIDLVDAIRDGTLSPRSVVIGTYALCGFANFSSVAIQIGGIGALAPERRADLARLGLRAMLAGALASWLTACIAGILTT